MASLQAACLAGSLSGNAATLRRSELVGAPLARSGAVTSVPAARRSLKVCAKVREIFMPALSSTMTEGKIVAWSKSEGDVLSKGESVVVVESDKADMDVETFYDGILAAILVNEGEVAPVGAPIGLLAESEEELEAAKAKAASVGSSAAAAPAAPAAAAPPPPPPPPAPVAAPVAAAPATPGKITASPHAEKLAKKLKVDLATVKGTGPYGRITPVDVEAAAGVAPTVATPATLTGPLPTAAPPSNGALPAGAGTAAAAAPVAPAPIPANSPFNAMQKAVAVNMVASLSVPVIHIGYTITMDAINALYQKLKPKGVTMTVLLAKAVALALAKHPVMNAACHDGASFTYNNNINVAVAVALESGGLITPVLQDADKVDVYTMSAQWKDLVARARKKQLQPQEYLSGTFTLSNLGMYGVDRFDAVVQKGQGAIMAVGGTAKALVPSDDGTFGVKQQMVVNVTADHRIIYGADVAEFLQTLAKILEDPKDLTL